MSNDNNTVLTEENIDAMNYKKVEESAQFIHMLYERFRKMGYALTDRKKRAAVRVLEAVLFEPLHEVELFGKEEQELFDICKQVMYHKNTLAAYAAEQQIKKEENKNE